ncbi:MAG: hypothetical protein ACLPWD_10455 [Methanobacterium sp.]
MKVKNKKDKTGLTLGILKMMDKSVRKSKSTSNNIQSLSLNLFMSNIFIKVYSSSKN